VVLYVANYRIGQKFDSITESTSWNLETIPLHLNPSPPPATSFTTNPNSRRTKRSLPDDQNEMDAEPEDPTTRYVFLSMDDVMEYRDFGVPLQLGNHDLKMREKSFYRNGDDVILTNKVDPYPGFTFNWTGQPDPDPNSYITVVLMDMKRPMEEEGLQIAMDIEPAGDADGESTASVTLDLESFDQLMDYEEAVVEMKKTQSTHRNIVHVRFCVMIFGALCRCCEET